MQGQIEVQKMQVKGQIEVQVAAAMHEMRKELEEIKAQATLGFKTDDKEFREKLEVLKEDRKDERVKKQAYEQGQLIAQRQGKKPPMERPPSDDGIQQFLEGLT